VSEYGEREQVADSDSAEAVGWTEVANLSTFDYKEKVEEDTFY
jgi:hypothetical protein